MALACAAPLPASSRCGAGMTAVTIRPMRWWDIPAVMEIEGPVFAATAWTAAQFWGELARDDRVYYVAVDGEAVIAYGGLMARRPTADVQTLAVHPAYRRSGIGRDLVVRLLAEAMSLECTDILLEVRSDNDAAISLYESQGFDIIARRTGYYGPGEDALIMRRRSP